MLRIGGKIPITIYPAFWIVAALIGFLNSEGSFAGTFIWIGIIFISVLFHEFGHALTAKLFGQKPRIELVALGGLTYHQGDKLPFWKQFFVVLDGPLFGFVLFLIAALLLQIPSVATGFAGSFLKLLKVVNLFWTAVNLLPVMPLDGGQLMRVILEGIFGFRGFRYALAASMVIALGISLVFFLYQGFLIGAFFFLFAFQSYDTWRKTRHLTETDRKDTLKEALEMAEEELRLGKKEEAAALFDKVRIEAREGMIYNAATQYLAYIKNELGFPAVAYQLLLPMRDELDSDSLCLLHRVAFEEKDFSLVVELAGTCFQFLPTAETALRNAFAHANLAQAEPAVGWLLTALQEGLQNLDEILADPSFDTIRHESIFKEFLLSHRNQSEG